MSEQPSAGSVPPSQSEFEDRQPPSWPKVIGIISMVFAGLGLFCVGCGALSPALMSMIPAEAQSRMPPMLFSPPIIQWVNLALGAMLAVYLLVSGVVLLSRNPAARTMFLIYGALGTLLSIWSMYWQINLQSQMTEWAQQNPDTDYAKSQQGAGGAVGQIIGWTLGLLFGFAWPLFCLIWFGAVKKKGSDIAEGKELLV